MQSFPASLAIWFDHGVNADANLHQTAKAIVMVLAVINPVVCADRVPGGGVAEAWPPR